MSGKDGNGQGNGHQSAHGASEAQAGRGEFLKAQLAHAPRPARMVALFSSKAMQPPELERLVEVCQTALREEDSAAALTLSRVGDERQRAFKVAVVEHADAAPQDCLVQVFSLDDPASPHRELLQHLTALDADMGRATRESIEDARSYLTITSGKLDDRDRIHPFENLVALFATALHALIVDPAAAMVTMDPGEWADAMEMSLEIESGLKLLRR